VIEVYDDGRVHIKEGKGLFTGCRLYEVPRDTAITFTKGQFVQGEGTVREVDTLLGLTVEINFDSLQSPTETTTQTDTSAPSRLTAKVTAPALNVRAGPGTDYAIVGKLSLDDSVEVVGRNAAGDWLQIVYPANSDRRGWIAADYAKLTGSLETVPEVSAPPPPSPSPAPIQPRTPTPATVLEWEGIYIGMPADDVLKIHPQSEATEEPVVLGNDSEGLVVRWSYPGAYLIFALREGEGTDSLGMSKCYRVIEIQLR
jgi:hypothetical protein